MLALDPDRYPGLLLVIDGSEVVARCGAPGARGLGLVAADLLGQPVVDLFHPADRPRVQAAVRRCREAAEGVDLSARVLTRRDPGVRRFELTVMPCVEAAADVLLVAGRDVHEQSERQERLVESAARFETLFERAQEALFVIRNDDGALVRVNSAMEDLLGWPRDQIVGQAFTSFVAPADLGRVVDFNRRRIASDPSLPATYPMRLLTHGGDTRIFQFRAEPFHVDGHVVGSLVDLGAGQRPLEESLDVLQRDGLVDLARSLSHEFNNVLGAILGFAELMSARIEHPSALRPLIQGIISEVDDGRRLADRIRVLARPAADERQDLDLHALIRECVAAVQARHVGGAPVTLDLFDGDVEVRGDPLLVRQMVTSLVSNALEAVDRDGHVSVSTRPGPGAAAATEVILEVADTGHGIPDQLKRRVFQPFFTTRRAAGHRGLGLAVVDAAVWALDGAIDLQSEQGRGTRVEVRMRRLATPPPSAPVPIEPPADRAPAPQGTVLVADDSASIRGLLVEILRDAGFAVISAADGDEAVAALESMRAAPAACVLDVVMPGRDGIAVARHARQRFPDTRIVIVSGHPEPASPLDAARDYDVFLHKPFRLDSIITALSHHAG